ncbi:DUF2537 domain-containing protein [Allokutzneria sp. A3M-2-11 16]|uniref:DUF2537 domain-containing protein n=1 Tax=Allokutzneria sp. A3M-2-11 16 TaxID=2962043 RepID=UPI0020B88BCC|nr:DUF2537 domain-containing protein [Allokutzneria sp. A3M-2-11 16]MCP3800133.1 DUF2537 domain-containing protein [Allokutzneria sp. A3M-2-11 16]
MELRAREGRAVLVRSGEGRALDPADLALPAALVAALHEWAGVARQVSLPPHGNHGPALELITHRGRLLAGRVAALLGIPVRYRDPISGRTELVEVPRTRLAIPPPPVPIGEPTPWATGLTVSLFVAVLVLCVIIALSSGLADASPWFALGANALIAAGLAPSLWLSRSVPVWRWVALGATAGLLAAWLSLILALFLG